MPTRSFRPTVTAARLALAAAVALTAVAWAVVPVAAGPKRGILLDDPVDRGRFEGTWATANRSFRMALWIREPEGAAPEVRVQFDGLETPDSFVTDWTGAAEYYVAGEPARFALTVEDGDANRVHATWEWAVQFPSSGREEHGRVTIHRAHDGRKIVLRFADFERVTTRGDAVRRYTPETYGITLHKASNRILLWDEIPF